jgi:Tol biopolymer transport system component
MPLEPGTRFGPYEVSGPLGAGGMGEVYRARDTKLGRDVAIKTLPPALASDKERLARFEREAQLLAVLNHPHIAAVYGLDVHDGTLYLAMELVEGETLEQKLKAGALPVEEALRLALQVAEALEAAHGKGVVHRDLKPANIMVTAEDRVKVLDFGLAKAFSGDPEDGTPAHSPALSLAMTQQGLVLGTAGYMSPEQASGQTADQRADIWSFGVVLYEMLTGLPLFSGESVPHVLADVLKTEPDWRRLPKNLHPRLKLLLERCLTKRPRDRLHSIADARVEIEAVLGAPEGVTPESAVSAAPRRSHAARLVAVAAGAAIIAGALVWFLRPSPASEPEPVVRFSVPLPADQSFTAGPVSMIAVSPDGTRIAYVANGQLFLRNLAESEARPVQGTDEGTITAAQPAFSPDGQWLAYVHVSGVAGPFTLKRVPITGGAPVTLHETSAPDFPRGLTWPTPDSIVFVGAEGVERIPANGGATEVLVPFGEDERFDSPQLLPGGDAVLFTRASGVPGTSGGYEAAQVVVQSIGKNDRTVVWDGGSAARYLRTGQLVYAQGGALFAIGFDPQTRAVSGGPVPILQGLRRSTNGNTDTANYAVSDTGTLAMIPGDPNAAETNEPQTTLTWVDRSGREEPLPVRPDDYTMARISPDGTKIALVVGAALVRDTPPAIWIFDERTENLSLLTGDPAGDDGPVWSSDSRRIYFRSLRGDTNGVYSIELDTGETTRVAASSDHPFPLPWTIAPDDSVLGLVDALNLNNVDISALSVADGEFTSLLHEQISENEPSISPNGTWLAYTESPAPGDPNAEINIRPFPGVARTRIPVGRGMTPVFSRDGSELFFVAGDELMAAAVTYEPTLRIGTPRRVIESNAYQWAFAGRAWDVDPSGERFLMIRRPGAQQAADDQTNDRIDVVLHWSEELEERVPMQ